MGSMGAAFRKRFSETGSGMDHQRFGKWMRTRLAMAPIKKSKKELEDRKIVDVNLETVSNTVDADIPGHYVDEDHEWSLDDFRKTLDIRFHYDTPYDASFSLIHVSAPIANAFRRILIANLPSIAIERVYVYNNTSVIQDEVLALRLGLLPLIVPEPLLSRMHWPSHKDGADALSQDIDTLVFKLQVTCSKNSEAAADENDPTKLYHHAHIYAHDLVWIPQGRQASWLGVEGMNPEEIPEALRVRCANPDVLIAKLRPKHELEVEMHAVKGCGQDHAKFSPVATATYRILPTIDILQPILEDDAHKFRDCFPPDVIGLEYVTAAEAARKGSGYEGKKGETKAVVKNAFADTVSRECLRHEEFQGKVKLGRQKDNFIFSVESTGQYESHLLFAQSIKTLRAKSVALKKDLGAIVR